jgi:hypothetical protein
MYEELNVVDSGVAFSRTLMGKECQACRRILSYKFFDHDSSVRDGYALLCPKCKATPRLSAAENYAAQREANFSSAAVAAQRRPDEEDYLDRESLGRVLWSSDIVHKLKQAGVDIITGPAAFMGEISLYIKDETLPAGAKYIGWLNSGQNQEFSEYSYNSYLVPTDEIAHGYRGILRNLVMQGYLTEDKCNKFFGYCTEKVWAKAMWDYRNK